MTDRGKVAGNAKICKNPNKTSVFCGASSRGRTDGLLITNQHYTPLVIGFYWFLFVPVVKLLTDLQVFAILLSMKRE